LKQSTRPVELVVGELDVDVDVVVDIVGPDVTGPDEGVEELDDDDVLVEDPR
jgi:hypothetical protein